MASFGAYLARERELRALSREDVVRQTRLSAASVAALEEDRFDQLPGEAFALGYIRSYAACIGLDPDDAVLRYREARQDGAPAAAAPAAPKKTPLAALVGVGLAAASIAFALTRWWRP